jgi:hypothetical protein
MDEPVEDDVTGEGSSFDPAEGGCDSSVEGAWAVHGLRELCQGWSEAGQYIA